MFSNYLNEWLAYPNIWINFLHWMLLMHQRSTEQPPFPSRNLTRSEYVTNIFFCLFNFESISNFLKINTNNSSEEPYCRWSWKSQGSHLHAFLLSAVAFSIFLHKCFTIGLPRNGKNYFSATRGIKILNSWLAVFFPVVACHEGWRRCTNGYFWNCVRLR